MVSVFNDTHINDTHILVNRKSLLLPVCVVLVLYCSSQTIVRNDLAKYKNWPRYEKIFHFYELNNFEFAWQNNVNCQREVYSFIQLSESLGLDKADYQFQFIQSSIQGSNLGNAEDSLDCDVRFTDAAIHFFTELKYGNKTPSFRYNGLSYNPVAQTDVGVEILTSLKKGSLQNLFLNAQPKSKEYLFILEKLNKFQKNVALEGFNDVKITSAIVDQLNKPLVMRLCQLGITDTIIKFTDKKIVTKKIIEAQKLFDLLSDGVLRTTTLDAFNIPLKQRIQELKIALNYLKWTESIRQHSSVLVLNIPSAYLMVYDKGKIIMDSKVVVGKASTPTPTLTSTITQVILYPYWMVPNKIATNELLPSIKRDIGILDRGNYQVLNKQGKVVDPYKVSWHSFNGKYFPYTIRQSTGCDNALGIVKFNFYNPFTVYLHDTPYKGLFSFNKRYFSHGCMRVENYLELARFLLRGNRIAIDTLTEKGCLYQQAPKPVDIEKELPIMILYSTVWYNKEGEVKFYDDVYGKLK